jgi:hypothetical protein
MNGTGWLKAGVVSVILMLPTAGMAQGSESPRLGVVPGRFINAGTTEGSDTLPDALTLSPGLSTNTLREPPLLSSRYTWKGHTVMPYIGAGLSHGQTKDSNGTLWQEERALYEPLGRALVPNEVQLGVRIPF